MRGSVKDTSRNRACQKDVVAGSLVAALDQAEICNYYTALLVLDPAVVYDLSTVLENFMYSKGYNENNVCGPMCGNIVCTLS